MKTDINSTVQFILILIPLRSRRTLVYTLDMSSYSRGGGTTTEENVFLSRVFAAPALGSLGARVNRLRRRGGHVGFTDDGDLLSIHPQGKNCQNIYVGTLDVLFRAVPSFRQSALLYRTYSHTWVAVPTQ